MKTIKINKNKIDFDDKDIVYLLIRAQKHDYIEINGTLYVPLKSVTYHAQYLSYEEVADKLKDKRLLNLNGYLEWFVRETEAQEVLIDFDKPQIEFI